MWKSRGSRGTPMLSRLEDRLRDFCARTVATEGFAELHQVVVPLRQNADRFVKVIIPITFPPNQSCDRQDYLPRGPLRASFRGGGMGNRIPNAEAVGSLTCAHDHHADASSPENKERKAEPGILTLLLYCIEPEQLPETVVYSAEITPLPPPVRRRVPSAVR